MHVSVELISYPILQLQLNDPTVFAHCELGGQVSETKHSSVS